METEKSIESDKYKIGSLGKTKENKNLHLSALPFSFPCVTERQE